MKKLIWCMLLVLGSCDEQTQSHLAKLSSTSFNGTLTLLGPVEGVEICAYPFGHQGRSLTPSGCGISDAQGHWSLAAGKLSGPAVLEAQGAILTSPLSAVTPDVPQFCDVGPIHLTPIAHLTAGYAQALVDTQKKAPSDAIRQARTEINGHFASLPHHLTRPWMPLESDENQAPLAITDAVQAHLFGAGLDAFAKRLSAELGIAEDTAVTLQTVLDALYQDIRADGVFDGMGSDGARLKQRDVQITGDTLRHELAVSIAQFLRGPRNQTGLMPKDVAPTLKALAMSQGRIFKGSSPSYSDEKPKLSFCHVVTQNGEVSSLSYPQRGLIEIACVWDDPSGIERAEIAVAAPGAARALTSTKFADAKASVLVDTRALREDIAQCDMSVGLDLTATNGLGFEATEHSVLHVMNSPPVLNVTDRTAAWMSSGEPLRIAGDVDRPLKRVVFALDGFEPIVQKFEYERHIHHFDLTHPLEPNCNQAYILRFFVEDWAGNQAKREFVVHCDEAPPAIHLIPSLFRQDFGGPEVDLGYWNQPVLFEKFFNTFDYLPEQGRDVSSQNLPVLVFSTTDQAESGVGTESAALAVEYSYAMNQDEGFSRGWSTLLPDNNGVYRLPLAYQILLPQNRQSVYDNFILRCKPDDLHRIVIRVTDLAGNATSQAFEFHLRLLGPPVYLEGCTPTGALMGANLVVPNFNWVYQDGFDVFDARASYYPNLPEGSLAPWAAVRIRVDTPPLHSHIQKVTEFWSRIATGKKTDHVIWHRRPEIQSEMDVAMSAVKHCGDGKRIGWSDGLCWPIKDNLTFPHTREHIVDYQSRQLLSVAPLHASAAANLPAGSNQVRIEPDSNVHLRAQMAGGFILPKEMGETPVDWRKQVLLTDGGWAVSVKHMFGVEADGDRVHYFERHFTVGDLTLTRYGLQPSVMSSLEGLPTPIGVEMDAGCSTPLHLAWDRTSTAPTES